MKGYWNKPEATRETLTPDGWLKTGDVAYVDKDNYFFIVDRKKVSKTAAIIVFLCASADTWGRS